MDEQVVRAISAKKKEPQWMLDFRLKAFRKWLTMKEPAWSDNRYPPINYQVSLALPLAYGQAASVVTKKCNVVL